MWPTSHWPDRRDQDRNCEWPDRYCGRVTITNLTGASETAASNVTVTINLSPLPLWSYTVDSEVDTHEVDTISDTPQCGQRGRTG